MKSFIIWIGVSYYWRVWYSSWVMARSSMIPLVFHFHQLIFPSYDSPQTLQFSCHYISHRTLSGSCLVEAETYLLWYPLYIFHGGNDTFGSNQTEQLPSPSFPWWCNKWLEGSQVGCLPREIRRIQPLSCTYFCIDFDGFRVKVSNVQSEITEDFICRATRLPLKGEMWFKNVKMEDVWWSLFMVSRKSTWCPKGILISFLKPRWHNLILILK